MKTRCRIAWVVAVGTAVAVAGPWAAASAQNPTVSFSNPTTPYTQNFDELRQNNGTSATMPGVTNRADLPPFTTASPNNLVGWRYRRGAAVDTFVRNGGSLNTGQGYSYGENFNDGEAALGVLTSGANTGSFFGVIIRNETGAAIPEVSITYVGEQWRFGGRLDGSADRLEFGYALNSNDLPGTAGTTAVPALDFNSPVTSGLTGERVGNQDPNRTTVTGTISFGGPGWEAGQDLALRWFDFNVAGSDDGLAIDNFQFVAFNPVPEPGSVLAVCGLLAGAAAGLRRARRRVA